MTTIKLFLFTGALLTALLVGCQPLIIPVTPTAQNTGQNSEPSATITTTTSLTETTTLTETAPMTESTAVSSSEPASATTSETAVVSATQTTTISATATPLPAPAANAATAEPALTVLIASLRIRSGPGTEYAVLGAAAQGEQYPIVGQANGCQWYQVNHPQLGAVWLSGGAQYVTTAASCDQLPEVAAPVPPTPAPAEPTATPAPAAPTEPAANPAPTEAPAQPANDPFPADQGCLLLQNQLGPELTFTFTSADGSWNDIVKVGSDQDVPYCFSPGRYRVTVDAPPPWADLNEEFEIKAGDRAYFPIRPQ